MTDTEYEEFLEELYAEGIEFARALQQWMILYAARAKELLPDKVAAQAFGEAVGWNAVAWGKAAMWFPEWFDNEDEVTAWQLMTLQKFATAPKEKALALYRKWTQDGCNWTPEQVADAVSDCKRRRGRGSSIEVVADVRFNEHDNLIEARPTEKLAWDRGNGQYVVRLRKKT